MGVLNRNIAGLARLDSFGTGPPGYIGWAYVAWRAGTKSTNLAQPCLKLRLQHSALVQSPQNAFHEVQTLKLKQKKRKSLEKVHDHVLKAKKVCTGQQRLHCKGAHRLRLMEIIPVFDPLSKIPTHPRAVSREPEQEDEMKNGKMSVCREGREWRTWGLRFDLTHLVPGLRHGLWSYPATLLLPPFFANTCTALEQQI